MKKYIPLVLAVSILAGCSNSAPAVQPAVYAETPAASEAVDPLVTPDESMTAVTTAVTVSELSAASVSAAGNEMVKETETPDMPASGDERISQSEAGTKETKASASEGAEEKTPSEIKVTYEHGSPRYDDDNAIKDVEMSESRIYIYTDDEGGDGYTPGEVIYYASIPLGDDMPECIEFIDIDTDEHVGYMYDDGKTEISGDETAGDGTYSIRIKYDLDINTNPDVSETWTRCYFGLYTDSLGNNHTCLLPTYVNVIEPVTEKEYKIWDEVQERIGAITSSSEYEQASVDEKEKMLLDELDILAKEGLVYEHLTRTNDSPRNVVFKIVKGPTMIIELEECPCGLDCEN